VVCSTAQLCRSHGAAVYTHIISSYYCSPSCQHDANLHHLASSLSLLSALSVLQELDEELALEQGQDSPAASRV
jgi:hypothetical protein